MRVRGLTVVVLVALLASSTAFASARRRVPVDVASQRPSSMAVATSDRGPDATTRKKKPAPSFVGCGTRAGDATDKALDVFVKKIRPALANPKSPVRVFKSERSLIRLDTKRAAAYSGFLECIRPLVGADPVPAAAEVSGRILLGRPASSATSNEQAPIDCLATFDGARAASLAVFTNNLPAIATDPTYPTFDTASLVIDDLRSRISENLAALHECVAGDVPSSPASTSACATAFLAALDAAEAKLTAAIDAIDASSASDAQKGLDRGLANAAYGAAITAATAELHDCAGGTGPSRRRVNGRSATGVAPTHPFIPPITPPHPNPNPNPDPAPPTVADCRAFATAEIKAIGNALEGILVKYIEGVEQRLDTDIPEQDGEDLLKAQTLMHKLIQQLFVVFAVRSFCEAVAREAAAG